MTLRLTFVVLAALILSACETMRTKQQMENFELSMKRYDTALRWSEIRDAASYHISRQGIPLAVDIEYAKQFSVTGINVLEKTMNPEITEANILVEINYFHKEYGTVKKIRQEQFWWFNKESGAWLIESAFPEFK